MTEVLAGAAGPASSWLLTYLLHSTVLLAAAWAVARAGWARSPVTLDVLWKLAAVAGVVGATAAVQGQARVGAPAGGAALRWTAAAPAGGVGAESPKGSAMASSAVVLARVRRVEVAPFGGGSGASGTHRASDACRAALGGLEGGVAPPDPAAVLAACGPTRLPWRGTLLAVWLAGAAALLLRQVRRGAALRGVRRRAAPPGPRARAALARLGAGGAPGMVGEPGARGSRRRMGPRPRVVESSEVDAPCVLGAGTIALPARCEEHLADDELEAVVAHELAHVLRWDVAWRVALRGLAALLWIQPLNRLAVAGAAEAAELACDDWAVGRTRPLGLARSIFRVAEWALPAARRPALVGVASGDGRALSRRVRRILQEGPSGPASRGRTLVLALLLLAPSPFLPVVGTPATMFAVVLDRTETVPTRASPTAGAAWHDDADSGEAASLAVRRVVVLARTLTDVTGDHRILIRTGTEDRPSR